MPSRPILPLLLAALPLVSGYMTGLNTLYFTPDEGGQRVYGGIRLDAEMMQGVFAPDSPGQSRGTLVRARDAALGTVDLPFSLVGDTLTLPLTVANTVARSTANSPQRTASAPQPQPTPPAISATPTQVQ